jgi:preprotein translocase subunit SecF
MIEIFRKPNYNFVGRRRWAYAISLLAMVLGLGSLATRGMRYDIDFTGGTLVQVRFAQRPDIARIRATLAKVQFGPQVGRELQLQAIYAVAFGLIGILLYLAARFDLKGGVAAVVAVFHDVIVCLGALSLFGKEFSLPVLAALLTIIGFSVNDTIVAYDRLRENRGKGAQRGKSFADQMNDAVNQTLSRTVLTSLTVFFSTAILLFLGGKVLEDFAFVLFVGVITGTYSTIYVAAALVVDWTLRVEGRRRGKKAMAKA